MPLGRWVIRTAESVVFTLCPPGPDDRKTSMRRSFGSTVTSTSSASGSTSTPAAEVWMRPCDSGDRHPLHAVHAALELQPRPDALVRCARLDRDRDVLVPAELGVDGVEHLGRPAAALGVAQVHAQQVAGEQRRLRAALPRLDLEDDVLVVVGVLGQQLLAQPVGQLLDRRCSSAVGLGGERRVLAGQLPGGGEVAAGLVEGAGGLDQRGRARRSAGRAGGRGLVGVHRRVGELALQGGVLGEQRGQPVGRARRGCSSVLLLGRAGGHDDGARPHRKGRAGAVGGATCRRLAGAAAVARLPNRFSKRATRPPVSRIFCLPV